jgi:hypothetical protein
MVVEQRLGGRADRVGPEHGPMVRPLEIAGGIG